MVQFECHRVTPLVTLSQVVNCRAFIPFSACGKGKWCMWLVNNMEIYFFKNMIHGLQMVQFECHRVTHPLVTVSFGFNCVAFRSLHVGKGNAACGSLTKWIFIFQKRIPGLQMDRIESHRVGPYILPFFCSFFCMQARLDLK